MLRRDNKKAGIMAGASRPAGPPLRVSTFANGSAAPVCPISRPQAPPLPRPINNPYIPRPVDLPSVIQAVNTIIQIITNEPVTEWREKERIEQEVRIYNPNDRSQWVDVIRIIRLVMENSDTGDLWIWEL